MLQKRFHKAVYANCPHRPTRGEDMIAAPKFGAVNPLHPRAWGGHLRSSEKRKLRPRALTTFAQNWSKGPSERQWMRSLVEMAPIGVIAPRRGFPPSFG